jgi:hypothetical protein
LNGQTDLAVGRIGDLDFLPTKGGDIAGVAIACFILRKMNGRAERGILGYVPIAAIKSVSW